MLIDLIKSFMVKKIYIGINSYGVRLIDFILSESLLYLMSPSFICYEIGDNYVCMRFPHFYFIFIFFLAFWDGVS